MANSKLKTQYLCTNCDYQSARWYGKCPSCGAWNSMEEQVVSTAQKAVRTPAASAALTTLSKVNTDEEVRLATGMSELDRVLGGGLVKGSVVLLGGEPGIGKSTLLLQICDSLSAWGDVLYLAGEESPRQIRLRADRLGVKGEKLLLSSQTDCESFVALLQEKKPAVAIVDSIQTVNIPALPSSAGSVTQVRECTNLILRTAKELEIPVILVGHVTKEGSIAGPKVLEHIVDAVLQMEGERHLAYRILRAVKNRFGSTNEIGVFSMEQTGLQQVENPSKALLEEAGDSVSGSCVACILEGTRPMLAEVQGLSAKTSYAVPRRMSSGLDQNRLALLLAVMEKRLGIFAANQDVFLNVAGGLYVDDPGMDLPVLLALVSSLQDKPIPKGVGVFGEVGLGGEIRNVPQSSLRIKELAGLGFHTCILPAAAIKGDVAANSSLRLIGVKTLKEAVSALQAIRAGA